MPPRPQSRIWRRLRLAFRGFRILVLLLILALLGGLIYLNRNGLPEFAKRPLLENLHARGLDLEMSRLRLHFYRGLVAEDVKFGRAETAAGPPAWPKPDQVGSSGKETLHLTNPAARELRRGAGPRLTARNVEVKINWLALAKRQWQVTAVVLDQGRLAWPVADTNAPAATVREHGGPPRELVVENIQANLRLLPGDEWALDHFHATFAGANFTLSGSVTNASAIHDWPLLRGQQPGDTAQRRLRRFADTLEKIHFATPPELRLVITGDARNWRSFAVRLALNAPDADTPWGKITRGLLAGRLFPAMNNDPGYADLSFQADAAQTPWADATNLDLALHLIPTAGQTNIVDADLTLRAASAASKWASVTNVQFTANWMHSLTNPIPLSGRGELLSRFVKVGRVTPCAPGFSNRADGAHGVTRPALRFTEMELENLRVTASLATPPNPPPADAAWAWWTNLQPFHLDWTAELSRVGTEKLVTEKVVCAGQWRAPELTVTNLHASFPDGALNARAQLDVATREARFDFTSNFDVQKIFPLLTAKARPWFEKISWRSPPALAGHGAVTLPAWTNRQPDWLGEVPPTLRLGGQFAVTNIAYLGVSADWVRSHFSCSNGVWHLPDLEAGRPEGGLRLVHITNERTKDYYWRVHSTMDLRALRPWFTPEQQRGLDLVGFTQPPVIDGEVWGRWHEYDRIGFQGRVTLTNFSVREQTASFLETSVRYTNRFLEFLDPRLLRGTQMVAAAGIAVDFNTQRIHFTNGFSTAEPLAVAHAIGPHIRRTIEPYCFTQPPRVRVSGYAPLHGSSDADLHFAVAGGPFEWWKFQVPHLAGEVHWLGETLTLTNVQAPFYGGDAAGFAHFNFTRGRGGDFNFTAAVTNASLPALLSGVFKHTNQLEGALSGRLVIASGDTAEPRSWTGFGRARLRDGLLWEIPIFGILSKPLDALMPGVANSRFSEASARFAITNGVIAWDKLEMRATTMRLQYDGTVDFTGRVDMRVEAEPLRDTWVIGRVLSLALWPVTKLFQFQITGTLDKPKSEPVYVPKLLFLPLHPIRTLEDFFSPDPEKTNAPPMFKEVP